MSKKSRIDSARTRARGAKAAIASTTLLVFGVAFVGVKAHAPGHAKGKAKALGAPRAFRRAVKKSIAEGGHIQKAIKPPPVVTSTS